MVRLIAEFFARHLELSAQDASDLSRRYYKDYGIAIEGLVRHHKIDPLEYNAQVDDAIPLESILEPDLDLRRFLQSFDRSKIRLWLLTNAYKTHGERVVKILGVDDLFDGLTYCDYIAVPFICKPKPEMYQKAMLEAGVENVADCYFVGTFYQRCQC